MHLAAVIWSLQILGQTVLDFRVSPAQILLTLATCAVLDMAFEFGKRSVIMWPASALLTANGIAFILRIPGTEHGDWWSLNGWWIYVAVGVFAILTKHLIRYRGRHIFNPSNVGARRVLPHPRRVARGAAGLLVGADALVGRARPGDHRAERPRDPRRVGLLSVAMGFWAAFAAGLAVISVADHGMTARWHFGPITGWAFWSTLVTSPEVLLFMFFMITDPKTVPRGRVARVAFAVCVGLLGALLIAPQKTEFGAKVGLLSALTIACAARPLLERFLPSPGEAGDRLGAALSHVVPRRALAAGALVAAPALYVVLLLLAGTPARLGGEALAASGPPPSSLPPVTVLHADDIASQIDRPLALRVAADAIADLKTTNDALRRRDAALAEPAAAGAWLADVRRRVRQATGGEEIEAAAHQVRRIQVGLARKPGQAAPAVLVTLAGTIRQASYGTSATRALRTSAAAPWSQTFEMARAETRYRIVAQRSAADHAGTAAPRATSPIGVRLAPTGPDSVPQGGRFGFRVTLRNPTDAGAGSKVELTLVGPDGVTVPFTTAEKLVPGGGTATLTSTVVPATWFKQLGDYEIAATVDGRAAPGRLRFAVTRAPVEVPRLDDVTDAAGVRTTVPAPACGTFSSGAAWGDVDGDGNLDLFVTRLGKPARLYMGDGKGHFSEQAARRGADVALRDGRGVRRLRRRRAPGPVRRARRSSQPPAAQRGRALHGRHAAGGRLRRRQRLRRRLGRRGRRRRPRPVRRQLRHLHRIVGHRPRRALEGALQRRPPVPQRRRRQVHRRDVPPARRDARRRVHRGLVRRERRRTPGPVPRERLRRPEPGLQPAVAQHGRRAPAGRLGGVGDRAVHEHDGHRRRRRRPGRPAGPRPVEHRRQPAAAQRGERDVHRRRRRVRGRPAVAARRTPVDHLGGGVRRPEPRRMGRPAVRRRQHQQAGRRRPRPAARPAVRRRRQRQADARRERAERR